MTKFVINRETLLKPLHLVSGVVERKQIKPILSHVLLTAKANQLTIIGTDSEVELHGIINIENHLEQPIQFTLPGKKFLEICKTLPENSSLEISKIDGGVVLTCERRRFTMPSLPVQEFPSVPNQHMVINLELSQDGLSQLLAKTAFAIPQQDVRAYLNGLLFEIKNNTIQTLATDGHRLAIYKVDLPTADNSFAQVIIPRKAILELMRLLDDTKQPVQLSFNNNLVRIKNDHFVLISKLINGKFPNFSKVIPQKGKKKITLKCHELKQALMRVKILSNELFHSVNFKLRQNNLTLLTNNPTEQEEAIEEIAVNYEDQELNIIFNINYFMELLNVVDTEMIDIYFENTDNGVVIEEPNSRPDCLYVLMPIRQ